MRRRSRSQSDPRRQYQTLTDAIDTLLTTTIDFNTQTLTGREILSNALRLMSEDENSEVIQSFLDALSRVNPDTKSTTDGVDDSFLDALERVDISTLPDSADCPICTNKFTDNDYPLIVKLPCSLQDNSKKEHIFDMDCIAPWLKMNSTCPLCRFNVHDAQKLRKAKLAEELKLAKESDEEDDQDEDWALYG